MNPLTHRCKMLYVANIADSCSHKSNICWFPGAWIEAEGRRTLASENVAKRLETPGVLYWALKAYSPWSFKPSNFATQPVSDWECLPFIPVMLLRNLRFWSKRVDVDSNEGQGTAAPVAQASRHECPALTLRTRRQLILSSSTTASKYKYGVQTLYDPESEAAVFDLVFVHGLTGSRRTTWTTRGSKSPWPETLLSKDIPNARILNIGYDADVVNAWAPASQNRVGEHANELNSALCDLRDETQTTNRPIIFVAHSLGGLVVKDALLTSKRDEKHYVRDIYDSTQAVAFLGTPHRGADLGMWAAWIGTYVNTLKKTNQDILNLLKPDSEVRDRINREFHRMLLPAQLQRRPIDIMCFFEELPVIGIGKIVSRDSAVLSEHDYRGIHGNHMEMTKFQDEHDPGYQSVLGVLRRWMREYQTHVSSGINSSTMNLAEEISNTRSTATLSPAVPLPSPIFSINNTGGGTVFQGNTIAGSVYFGNCSMAP